MGEGGGREMDIVTLDLLYNMFLSFFGILLLHPFLYSFPNILSYVKRIQTDIYDHFIKVKQKSTN